MSSDSLNGAVKTSPMMLQWRECKEKAGSAILLFRLGDFYEAFYEDAITLASELDLTLTSRQDVPMSGIPHHTYEAYADKLLSKGYKVAIAEQVEDAKVAKGLVKRDVVKILSPGTVINSSLIDEKKNNYICAFTKKNGRYALSFIDITTADFWVAEFADSQSLIDEIFRLQPKELVLPKSFCQKEAEILAEIKKNHSFYLNIKDDWSAEEVFAENFLKQALKVKSLDGFGLAEMPAATSIASFLLKHLVDEKSVQLEAIHEIRTYNTANFMTLDRVTQKNLELTCPLHESAKGCTLLAVLDKTSTPMGARLLRQWIKQPLLKLEQILARQDAIEEELSRQGFLSAIKALLAQVKDIERLIMKISTGNSNPKDILMLSNSFIPVKTMQQLLAVTNSDFMLQNGSKLDHLPQMNHLIQCAFVENPALKVGEGRIFKDGFNAQLDELVGYSQNNKTWLMNYQSRLREETNIKNLKVSFNKMFGYYIDVGLAHTAKVPSYFIRRQTLVSSERYITDELKSYEEKIVSAEDRLRLLETALLEQIKEKITSYAKQVLSVAKAIAHIDAITSLAEVAKVNNYFKPTVDLSDQIVIRDGRHPVIEKVVLSEKFVENDLLLDAENQLLVITGPNMAGKSTYLRQTALIIIMAQMGSFVPALNAKIGLIDRIFCRIGASDDLSKGHSTFMVEMCETANILNHATSRSLVILDEVGRGTSTYDGISIAWSVAEFLLTNKEKAAKTLFATHYWELTELEDSLKGAVNFHVAVHETENEVIFLRKIIKGKTDKSFGIYVAKLAGFPTAVLQRAEEILTELKNKNREKSLEKYAFTKQIKTAKTAAAKSKKSCSFQMSLFDQKI